MLDTLPRLQNSDFHKIHRGALEALQLNLGYLCNQQCLHCHVDASPKRTELMSRQTMDEILSFALRAGVKVFDLTGGAPEMNPHFRYLVEQARALDITVMDRCNLTILSEPGYEWLTAFLAQHQVEVVASLPCYLEENVDAQRGNGVFERSIEGLQHLNGLGYGDPQSDLTVNLVYNPQGASLPPPQQALQEDYQKILFERYGIRFNQLFTLANVPVKRFGSMLLSKGTFDDYLQVLKDSYSEKNLNGVMCRSLLSLDWQGYVYDCDFNQMLRLPAGLAGGKPIHINELAVDSIAGKPISVLQHCYACTAGQGSSCGGALNG